MYVCNVMTQFRETAGFKASDHVRALVAHTSPGILQVCLVNTRAVPEALLEKYRQEHAEPVAPDVDAVRKLGYQVVADEVISAQDYVRHDSDKLARLIISLSTGARRAPVGHKTDGRWAAAAASHSPNREAAGVEPSPSRAPPS
jgi:uncharacterized cofD-like protein